MARRYTAGATAPPFSFAHDFSHQQRLKDPHSVADKGAKGLLAAVFTPWSQASSWANKPHATSV